MTGRIRVLLVDDHEVTRAGVRSYLSDDFEVVGEADEVDSAIELICERQPDLVLLDVRLPGGGGAAVIEAVHGTCPDVRFVAFTVETNRADVLRVIGAGVHGYLTKTTLGNDLSDLLLSAMDGGHPISPEVAGHILDVDDSISVSGFERITAREREIVHLIARGLTYKEVARRLGCSTKTVETHMRHIFDKLGVSTRHQLSALAYEAGFVRPDERHVD